MEIRQLKHFLAIAETRSFTRAAVRVHLSQPAISASIANLEDELGKPLFIRAKKQVTLTSEGKELLKSAKTIVAEYRELKQRFNANRSRVVMSVLLSHTFPMQQAVPILNAIEAAMPHVVFSVSDFVMDLSGKSLVDTGCDMALAVVYQTPASPKGYQSKILKEEPYGVIAPLAHPFADMPHIALKDIVHEPVIARLCCEYQNIVLHALKAQKIWLNVKHKTEQDARAIAMVEAGLGITIAPQSMQTDTTCFIPFSEAAMRRQLVLYVSDAYAAQFNELESYSVIQGWNL